MTAADSSLIQEKAITSVPAPTRLLLANPGLASAIPLLIILMFGITLWVIKRRVKDEADQLTFLLMAHSGVWFLAIFYFSGVSMAAFLPWVIAINR